MADENWIEGVDGILELPLERRREIQLAAVQRATRRRREAERAWKQAIREAVDLSLRECAKEAGVSHARVHQIMQG